MGIEKQKLEWIVYGLVGIAPLLLGSVHQPSILVFLAILIPFFLFQAKRGKLRSSEIAQLSFGMVALSVIQLIPFPSTFPISNTEIFVEFWGYTSTEPTPWRPLSMEPLLTVDRGLRFFAVGLLAMIVASLTTKRFYRRAIFASLVMGWVTLFWGSLLWLSGTNSILGFAPSAAFRGPSPFINLNHGASYFALLALAAIAYWEVGKSRLFAIISGASFGVAAIYHNSIGTSIVFFLVGLFWMCCRRKDIKKHAPKIAVVIFFLMSLLVLAFWLELFSSQTIDALLTQSQSRWLVTKAGFRLARDWPLFGSGLGSTDTAILRYIDWAKMEPASIPTLENELLEFFGTVGIGGGVLFLGGNLFFWAQALKTTLIKNAATKARWHVLFWTMFIGIAALHFPWFTLGLAFPFVLLIESTRTPRRSMPLSQGAGISMAFMLSILVGSLFYWQGREDLIARPLFSKSWISKATEAIQAKDYDKALIFAELAVELDPRPKTVHYLARVVAKRGDTSRAENLYRFAFTRGKINNRLITDMLTDLPNASDRNSVLGSQPVAVWIRGAEITAALFGPDEAVVLSFDALENGIYPTDVQKFLIQLFVDLEQPELAKMWTDTQNIDDALLIAIYLQQKNYEAFFKAVEKYKTQIPQRYILKKTWQLLKDTGPQGIVIVKDVYNDFCRSPLEGPRRRLCWSVGAQLEIEAGNEKKAEIILKRILNRSADPRPLAQFYVKTGQCRAIKKLVFTQQKHKKALEGYLSQCRQH